VKSTPAEIPRPPPGTRTRRSGRKRIPSFPGVPSITPGGRHARWAATTIAMAAGLAAVLGYGATEVSAHAAKHRPCVDLPVVTHPTSEHCHREPPRVFVVVPVAETDTNAFLHIRGKPYTPAEVLRYLRAFASAAHDRGEQRIDVIIRADRHVPWRNVQHVLAACEALHIFRVHFAVRPSGSQPCLWAPRAPTDDPITNYLKEQIR